MVWEGDVGMKLFRHQVDGLKQTKGHPNCALYWDMGLGKTFGGSEKMKEYGNDTNVVICQKSKVNDWVKHFRDHYPDVAVHDLTKKGAIDEFLSWFTAWHGWHGANMTVAVINYELAWRRPALKQLKDFTLMLDESSLIQNRTAKQTKFILQLNPKNVILLSGTPTAGKYENLWTQAHLLGWKISEDLYNSQYVNWKTIESDGFFHKIVDKDDPYKNVDRLKQKFRDHGAVFMKTEEVFDLPAQTFTTVTVPTSKEYRKFMKTGVITIDTLNLVEFKDDSDFHGKDVTPRVQLIGDQIFSKRLYARQLCGMYSKAKLEAFKELLQSTNDRVIVFYNFNRELERLNQIALDLGRPTSWVNGQEKDLYCYEHYDNSVTLIQYQAGAMGLNLQKANKIIYFSLPERSDLFEQSKARIHRIGQDRPCFYWVLLCEKSVEEAIHATLQDRKDFTDELFIESCP
jgi:SNF2 family DNA or RNA helicase